MNQMGFWEKVLQDRDQVRKFFGDLFMDWRDGLCDGRYLLYSYAHKAFFSLPLYRSRKIRTA